MKDDRWARLKKAVIERHNYFEDSYKQTNFSADASKMGVYWDVYQMMQDLERAMASGTLAVPQKPEVKG